VETEIFGADAARVEGSRLNLSVAVSKQGRFAEAAVLRQGILEDYRKRFGPDDPRTYTLVANQAADLELQGNHAAAEPFFLEALASIRRVLGPDHTVALEVMTGLANARAGMGRYAEAERLNLEVLATVRRLPGTHGREVGIALYNLVCEAALQHHRGDALRYLREAVALGMPVEILAGIDQESDLASLRGDKEFEALVASAKAHPAKD
jgi:tetratricopeptide (TPR) repeat protein